MFRNAARFVVTVDVASGKQTASFLAIEAGRYHPWGATEHLALSPDGTKLALISHSSLEAEPTPAKGC